MTKAAEIVWLAKSGERPVAIADELGISIDTVNSALRRARRRGEYIPKAPLGRRSHYQLKLTWPEFYRFREAAMQRNIPTAKLIKRLLTIIVEEDMIDAILDDMEPNE